MGPRFYAKLWVRHDGIAIHAAGPVGTWKWDTTYGYVAAVIVQNGVKGHGMSARIHRDDSHWHARVLVDRHRFHHGPAVAHGVLLIPDGRSAYSYAWTVPVELVKR